MQYTEQGSLLETLGMRQVKIGFVSLFFWGGCLAMAQTALPPDQPGLQPGVEQTSEQDPEDRNHGVARISLLNGDVSVKRGDSGDQVAAAVNAPLLAQDYLLTGPASRAEVQFDTANRVRFANDTEVRFSQLTSDRFQVQIAQGTLTWAVLGSGSLQGEIATPSVALHALGIGQYRVSILPDGTSQITVRSGVLEAYSPRGVERIEAGQTMLARGEVDNPEFQTVTASARDEWDVFNERRDSELRQSQSYNYVSRDITGAEDLDNYGQWNQDPTYGEVWTPRVASDWAPYRLGRWGYEDYYGWTWISSDPWGWAPYHYGNWFQGSLGWSWYPGPRYGRYSYRPALVAFFGFGNGGGNNGWKFGNVGWVPLAPYERYNRWYGRGFRSYGGGIVNNINVYNSYRNARAFNGLTALNSRDFANGHFGRYSTPAGNQLYNAGLVRGQVPFAPTSNHYRFNERQTSVRGRSDFNQTRFAFGRNSSSSYQGYAAQTNSQQRFTGFGRSQNSVIAQNTQSSGSSNWQRFGNPNRPLQSNPSYGRFTPNSGGSSNWQRFGNPDSSRQNFGRSTQGNTGGGFRQFDSPQRFQRGNSQSVQVAPPVVRERQQQYRDFGRSDRSFGQQSKPNFDNNRSGFDRPSFNNSERRSFGQPRMESRPSNQGRQDFGRQSSGGGGFRNDGGGSRNNNHESGSRGRR